MALRFPTRGWTNGWRKPDRRPIEEWAADNVVLPESYAKPGRFSVASSRHLIEPFRAVQDPFVREVTCAGAIQTGKTLVSEISIAWAVANEPGPVMWTLQTDDDARQHCKERFMTMLETCKGVTDLMPRGRYDRQKTAIYFGPFFVTVNGANISNLQRVSIRWKFNSEVWLWDQGLLEHARGRVTAFERSGTSKVVNESQGGIAGDDFDRAWQAGHQAVWAVRCEGCREHVPLTFFAKTEDGKYAGVVWNDDAREESGDWNVARVAETARFKCSECGHEHDDTPRTHARWNTEGAYVTGRHDAPEPIRSFRWEALVSRGMASLAAQWAEASNQKHRGVMQGVKDFYQKRCALPWDESTESFADVIEVTSAGYRLADVEQDPTAKIEGEAHRLMTIDRQKDHFWAVIRAWRAEGNGSRLLWCGKLLTPEECREKQTVYGVPDKLTFEDAQYNKDAVYDDCVRWNWTALHGSGRDGFKHELPNKTHVMRFFSPMAQAQHKNGFVRYVHWASDPVKDTLHRLYAGQGAPFDIADDVPEFYRAHMKGEAKRETTDKQTGRRKMRWVVLSSRQNHLRDCEAMGVAVAYMLRLLTIEKHERETANAT